MDALTAADVQEYLLEVALGAEYGETDARIRKWAQDIRLQVVGPATSEDMATVRQVVDELNGLLAGIRITHSYLQPNASLYFAPEAEFRVIEPNYVPTNYGFLWLNWNAESIYLAKMLVATDHVTPLERCHLIREVFAQSLGLLNHSLLYPDSIFYKQWTATTAFAPVDREVIRRLYRPEIRHNMSADQVQAILKRAT